MLLLWLLVLLRLCLLTVQGLLHLQLLWCLLLLLRLGLGLQRLLLSCLSKRLLSSLMLFGILQLLLLLIPRFSCIS